MSIAKKDGIFITLTIASFKEGRKKIDDLYLHNFSKSKHVKSLFSNLLLSDDKNDPKRNLQRSLSELEEDEEEEREREKEEKEREKEKEKNRKSTIRRSSSSSPTAKSSSSSPVKKLEVKKQEKEEQKYFINNHEEEQQGGGGGEEDEDGAMIAGKKVIRRDGDLLPTTEEEEKEVEPDDQQSVDSEELGDDWNALTKVEGGGQAAVFPFTTVVGVSPWLQSSKKWGDPRHYIQFSNFSSAWRMEIFWIDQDGVLITRNDLFQGATHFELFSSNHVWAVVATPLRSFSLLRGGGGGGGAAANNGLGGTASAFSLLVNKSHESATSPAENSLGQTATGAAEESSSPVILLLRPSKSTCKEESKCLSLLWSPGSSLSLSNLLYSKVVSRPNSEGERRGGRARNSGGREERIRPAIHVQLFETVVSKESTGNNNNNNNNSNSNVLLGESSSRERGRDQNNNNSSNNDNNNDLGKLTRKPLRSSRLLSKIHKQTKQQP
jgi:hypothetical protein